MEVTVHVAVALSRPPREDRWSKVIVDVPVDPADPDLAAAEQEAELTAVAMATGQAGVVMAVRAETVAIEV